MLPTTAGLGPRAKQNGTDAWHYILMSALNGLDAHGNCVSCFGPPTAAKAKALQDLLEDCERFVADVRARTPTDFKKELGAKLRSYWGEPVFCA